MRDREIDPDREKDGAEGRGDQMCAGEPRPAQGGVAPVGQPVESERDPADEVEMGMNGRELEVVRDAHPDPHADAHNHAQRRQNEEEHIVAKHGEPLCCSSPAAPGRLTGIVGDASGAPNHGRVSIWANVFRCRFTRASGRNKAPASGAGPWRCGQAWGRPQRALSLSTGPKLAPSRPMISLGMTASQMNAPASAGPIVSCAIAR